MVLTLRANRDRPDPNWGRCGFQRLAESVHEHRISHSSLGELVDNLQVKVGAYSILHLSSWPVASIRSDVVFNVSLISWLQRTAYVEIGLDNQR